MFFKFVYCNFKLHDYSSVDESLETLQSCPLREHAARHNGSCFEANVDLQYSMPIFAVRFENVFY